MRMKPMEHCWFHKRQDKITTLGEELRFFFVVLIIVGFYESDGIITGIEKTEIKDDSKEFKDRI